MASPFDSYVDHCCCLDAETSFHCSASLLPLSAHTVWLIGWLKLQCCLYKGDRKQLKIAGGARKNIIEVPSMSSCWETLFSLVPIWNLLRALLGHCQVSATKVPRGQEQLTQTLIMCLLKTHNKATCPPSLPEYLPQFSVLKTNFSTLLTTRRRRILGPGMWTEETSATEKTTTKSRTTMRRTQTALSGKRFGLLFSLFHY